MNQNLVDSIKLTSLSYINKACINIISVICWLKFDSWIIVSQNICVAVVFSNKRGFEEFLVMLFGFSYIVEVVKFIINLILSKVDNFVCSERCFIRKQWINFSVFNIPINRNYNFSIMNLQIQANVFFNFIAMWPIQLGIKLN